MQASDEHSLHPDQSTSLGPAGSNGVWWMLVVGLAAAMLCLPFFRSVFWLGDEGVMLHAAENILHGDSLYVDFFEFPPPGGFLVVAAWFVMAGTSICSARALALLPIVGLVCFTFLSCRQRSARRPQRSLHDRSCRRILTQINHHWLTTRSDGGCSALVSASILAMAARAPDRRFGIRAAAMATHARRACYAGRRDGLLEGGIRAELIVMCSRASWSRLACWRT